MKATSSLALLLLLLAGIAAPLLLPDYTNQLAVLWLMIVFASALASGGHSPLRQ